MSEALLAVGMAAAVVFVAVFLVEGALRSGYDPAYHTVSQLSVGNRGWIQIANFLLMGVAMLAFAVGVEQTAGSAVGAVLLAVFGLGAIASGLFVTDPMRGYPPGAPVGTAAEVSWHHKVHDAVAPPMFLAIFGACLALLGRLDGAWRLYTLFTAIAGLALTVGTAVAYQKDAANTGLVQRALLLVYWTWIVLLGSHLL